MKDYYVFFSESFLEYPDNSSNAIICSISGCNHNCIGCHSPLTQLFIHENAKKYIGGEVELETYYKFTGIESTKDIIQIIRNITSLDNTLVITGGDCLQCHPELVAEIVNQLNNDYNICIYTGLKPEQAQEVWNEYYQSKYITNNTSSKLIFKCGSFKQNLYITPEKTDEYIQLSSKNQCFCDNNFQPLSIDGKLIFNK